MLLFPWRERSLPVWARPPGPKGDLQMVTAWATALDRDYGVVLGRPNQPPEQLISN